MSENIETESLFRFYTDFGYLVMYMVDNTVAIYGLVAGEYSQSSRVIQIHPFFILYFKVCFCE